jgi:hypothetical protein
MRNVSIMPFDRKVSLAAVALAGLFAFTAVPLPVHADDDCQVRIAKIDHKLHEAIEHHGAQSSQADHWRHELQAQRERCWSANKRWWDEDDHRWHTDRDWDDHDHDGGHH